MGFCFIEVMVCIYVVQFMGGVICEIFVLEVIKNMKKYDKNDFERRRLVCDEEFENGGVGVFNVDFKRDYFFVNLEWKYDKIFEIYDGKNVYDYVDLDIDVKFVVFEEEEECFEKEGFYKFDLDVGDEFEEEVFQKVELICEKYKFICNEVKMCKFFKNCVMIFCKLFKKLFFQFEDYFD